MDSGAMPRNSPSLFVPNPVEIPATWGPHPRRSMPSESKVKFLMRSEAIGLKSALREIESGVNDLIRLTT